MGRPIVLSNGELHVGLNKYGVVHDFYYPYVGLENHAAGKSLRHRIGVWIDGSISWLDDHSWQFDFSYPHHSLIGHTVARNDGLGILLEFEDFVDVEFSAFIRNVHIVNTRAEVREVRIFFHQAFDIGDSRSNTDTAQYLPDDNAILHYRGRRAFIISGVGHDKKPFDQMSVGLFDIEGHEGTYRDADDGELMGCAVEHGRVDSTIRFSQRIDGHGSVRIHYWVACGTSTREALYIHKQMVSHGVHERMNRAGLWWHDWLKPASETAAKLDKSYKESFLRSVMIMKAHIDKRGAVMASTDTSILNYSRDAYAYCWPRDAAYTIWPLIRMGYKDEPYRFFEFCRRVLSPGGYLMHKFRADGALGSSWHPYLHENGIVAPPIQEDETAITLFVFSQFYHIHQDAGLLKEFYEPMVLPMADFLASYIDTRTGLPKPTYDLWEEQFMTTTYTTAVVYAALHAAADLAEVRKDDDSAVRWRVAASDIQSAAKRHLYDSSRRMFRKGLRVDKDSVVHYDNSLDASSLYGAFMYGLFPLAEDEVAAAVTTLCNEFGFSKHHPGLPRYENDNYHRSHDDSKGNYWFIASLWIAQYSLEIDDTATANSILQWVRQSALQTGTLGEQVDPRTLQETSVSPLAWSQAEYVSTLLDTITDVS